MQQVCYWITENVWFKTFILTVVVVNTGLLASQFYGQSDGWSWILVDTDAAFVGIYAVECVLKFTASRTIM